MEPDKVNPPNSPNPPEVTPEKPPEYSYNDLHKEPIKDIADNKVVPEVKPAEPTAEEKAKIEADNKAKAEAEAKEEEIDIDKLSEDVAAKAAEKVAEKLAPKEEVAKDKYDEFFDKVQKEKGREPNWKELSQFLEDQAVVAIEGKQEEARKAEAKAKEDQIGRASCRERV
jgi:hypothetical protein